MKLVHCRKQNKIAALRRLVENGQAIRRGAGIKGDPFLYAVPANAAQFQQTDVAEEIVV
jgi:hypothetical protein